MRARAARLAALAGLLLFIALASTAEGATANVSIAGFAFVPASVTINAGDTVTWRNNDQAAHSAVFANGNPQTPVLANGQSASIIFNSAGTFNYICGIHGASMSGTVIVRAAATAPPTQPPTVAPTPVPTARPTVAPTIAPTVAPTVAPTTAPTVTPTPSPSPSPIPTAAPASATPSATPTPTVAVAAPTEQAPAPAAANDGGNTAPLLLGLAAVAVIAAVAFALTRIKR